MGNETDWTKIGFWVLVVVVIGSIFGYVNLSKTPQSAVATQQSTPSGTTTQSTFDYSNGTSVQLTAQDKYGGTSGVLDVEGGLISTDSKTLYENSAAITTALSNKRSPGESFLAYWYDDNQTTSDIFGNTVAPSLTAKWYGELKKVTIPVQASAVFQPDYANGKMVKAAASTFNWFNADGTLNGLTDKNQALASDTTYQVRMDITAPTKAAFGHGVAGASDIINSAGVIIGFDYNSNEIDSVEVVGGTKVTVPGSLKATLEEAWLFKPSFNDTRILLTPDGYVAGMENGVIIQVPITIDTDDSINPSISMITGYNMDSGLYWDEKVGLFKVGVSDEADADLYVADVSKDLKIT